MRLIAISAASLCLSLGAAEAAVSPVACSARINGMDVQLTHERNEPGLRERLFNRRGHAECPAYVVLRSLTPELTDQQRSPFCLRHDTDSDSIIGYDLGTRDDDGLCQQPSASVCQRVNQTRDAALAVTGAAARGAVRGLRALPDGSGAAIISGSASHISSALNAIGGAASTAAASPAIMAGAAVTVVAVGGALYACSD